MKRKIYLPIATLLLLFSLLCSCEVNNSSSIKSLTNPYINEYVCTYAYLGDKDILEEMDYIKVTFIDNKILEASFKKKEGKRHSFECGYVHDSETGEIIIDFGIFGADNKPRIIINDGKFTISKQLCKKLLVMVFEVK